MVQADFPDVTISKIRFLESQGLLEPDRTTSGYRKFFDADVERLRWILHQQRDHYLPLKVIKDRIQNGLAEPDASEPVGDDSQTEPVPSEATPEPEPAATDGADDGDLPPAEGVPSEPAPVSSDAPTAATPDPLDDGMSTVSMTADELASAAGISTDVVDELSSFGLIEARTIGAADLYEGEALQVARLASKFIEHGVETRHLKMYRIAADREAGFYEQVVSPLSSHRDPTARSRARTEVGELVGLGQELKSALLRRSLREHLGGP